MVCDRKIEEKILEALALESMELAKIIKILRLKLEKTEQWLPVELACVPLDKRIKLAIEMQKTISNEILAVATKEKAIGALAKVITKDKHCVPVKHCSCDCNWWSFLEPQSPVHFHD